MVRTKDARATKQRAKRLRAKGLSSFEPVKTQPHLDTKPANTKPELVEAQPVGTIPVPDVANAVRAPDVTNAEPDVTIPEPDVTNAEPDVTKPPELQPVLLHTLPFDIGSYSSPFTCRVYRAVGQFKSLDDDVLPLRVKDNTAILNPGNPEYSEDAPRFFWRYRNAVKPDERSQLLAALKAVQKTGLRTHTATAHGANFHQWWLGIWVRYSKQAFISSDYRQPRSQEAVFALCDALERALHRVNTTLRLLDGPTALKMEYHHRDVLTYLRGRAKGQARAEGRAHAQTGSLASTNKPNDELTETGSAGTRRSGLEAASTAGPQTRSAARVAATGSAGTRRSGLEAASTAGPQISTFAQAPLRAPSPGGAQTKTRSAARAAATVGLEAASTAGPQTRSAARAAATVSLEAASTAGPQTRSAARAAATVGLEAASTAGPQTRSAARAGATGGAASTVGPPKTTLERKCKTAAALQTTHVGNSAARFAGLGTMVAVSMGEASRFHTDKHDHAQHYTIITVLKPALLVLPELFCSARLNPGDVVGFLASKYQHKLVTLPDAEGGASRRPTRAEGECEFDGEGESDEQQYVFTIWTDAPTMACTDDFLNSFAV